MKRILGNVKAFLLGSGGCVAAEVVLTLTTEAWTNFDPCLELQE